MFFIVYYVSLSNSSVPYKGVVQITTDSGTKNVCWQSLNNNAERAVVCRHLGYKLSYKSTPVNISNALNVKDSLFSGSINCDSSNRYLSQCSINVSSSAESCSELTHIECRLCNIWVV